MMVLRIAINKLCRGNGLAYFLLETSYTEDNCLNFCAESELGIAYPLESYEYDFSDKKSSFVLVVPMLSTKKISFYVKDSSGQVCSNKITFSWAQVKWLSRLNYKIESKITSVIRDIDKYTYSNQIHINTRFYIRAKKKGEIVYKGIVSCPYSQNSFDIRLLDGNGLVIPNVEFFINKTETVDYEGVYRRETPFSVRIPDDGKTYCLVVDGIDGCHSSFMCFSPLHREAMSYENRPPFFAFVDNDSWRDYQEKRRRSFLFATSSDYQIEEGPKFSVIVPLYNTPVVFFKEMVSSVLEQLYEKWELILVNSTPDNEELSAAIAELTDERIKVVCLDSNYGIAENTNRGLEQATGDYVAFFDHDDVLDKLVLYRYASLIVENAEIDALYCDEDLLDENGEFTAPHIKSDFNIDLLRCHNYITHLLCVKTDIAKSLTLRSEYDGAQDYDFVLRLSEFTSNIVHVPEVLYHWRISDTSTAKNGDNKSYAQDAGLNALNSHIERVGLSAKAMSSSVQFLYRTEYYPVGNPLVSIIIPNKDSVEILSQCLESIYEKTSYSSFEIIIVENNSVHQETFDYYKHIQDEYENLRVVFWGEEFNYSRINNFGVQYASGDYLLLLNNDIEVISSNWLESMLGYCQRLEVGIVGARLLYPDGTVQHAGVAMSWCKNLSETGGPVHVFNHLDESDGGYMNRAIFSQDVSIVTGACLMTSRALYEEVGGLSEEYAVAYNDVDFCLKVRDLGYLVVYDANIHLRHYESFSRGGDGSGDKIYRFCEEQGRLKKDWPKYYIDGDSYYGKWFDRWTIA